MWNNTTRVRGESGYGKKIVIILIFLMLTALLSGCVKQSIGPDEATRIALNDTRVRNMINSSSFEVHTPSRETVREGDNPPQELWNVQVWIPDQPFIIIVEVADDGSVWGVREGHNPNFMQPPMMNTSGMKT
jgi:hypothetical protein